MERKLIYLSTMLVAFSLLFVPFALEAKPSARGLAECKDGVDNDGDGYTDWPSDPGCSSKNDKSELNPGIECDDGSDNDGDSDTDMDDAGCSSPTDDDETDCGDSVCEGGETQQSCPEDCGYPDSCSDTDSGNYPFTFGITSGYYDSNPYSNDDYCSDSGTIVEYYCSGDYEQSQQQSCGTDGYVGGNYCMSSDVYRDYRDYYCTSGECGYTDTPTLQEDCDGTCTNGICDPYCGNNEIEGDEVCDGTDLGGETCQSQGHDGGDLACNPGCTGFDEGGCYDNSCNDTDGGWVPAIQGTVSGDYIGYPYNYTDYCNSTEVVMEYYCSGEQWDIFPTYCMNATSCINGACVY